MPGGPAFLTQLSGRLGKARRLAVVGIGDELRARDRLGMLAAREVEALHLPDVAVFLAGTVPESFTGPVRRFAPDHVILLDAADMKSAPGTVAVVDATNVRGERLSTHALPLSVVMEYLEAATAAPVTLVGLQPDMAANDLNPTGQERRGIRRVVHALQQVCTPRAPKAR